MKNRRILLIVGGGIAAYKSLDLIRRLRERGADVRCILTAAGGQFVTPLSLAALSGHKVYGDLFSLSDEAEMGHIRLSREADLVVVAPATADLMAKMANGLADDLASTTLLATDKPVMIAPSMNLEMWRHPATRRNLARLEADGVLRVGPEAGNLACGEQGDGRLAEVSTVIGAIARFFEDRRISGPLAGRHALVTAGPTLEAIDPVRHLTNRSSGKQGYAIAAALARSGARVTLVSGPVALAAPDGVERIEVESARQMLAACEQALPADIAVCVAAVADWRPGRSAAQKLSKHRDRPTSLELVENPDILRHLAKPGPARPALVVGFAAETGEAGKRGREKLATKGCDWIVANDVSPETGVMGGDHNRVELITAEGAEAWERAAKSEVAARLVARIAGHFDSAGEAGP